MLVLLKTKDGLEATIDIVPEIRSGVPSVTVQKKFSFTQFKFVYNKLYKPTSYEVPPRYIKRAVMSKLTLGFYLPDDVPINPVLTTREYEYYGRTLTGIPMYREI